jgi:hypothetical protein
MEHLTLFALHSHQNTKYQCSYLDNNIQLTTDYELLTVMERYHDGVAKVTNNSVLKFVIIYFNSVLVKIFIVTFLWRN